MVRVWGLAWLRALGEPKRTGSALARKAPKSSTTSAVATFISPTDPNPNDFTGFISWGDGIFSNADFIAPLGPVAGGFEFAVVGSHVYSEETNGRLLSVAVDISDAIDSTTATALSRTVVADSALTGTSAPAISGTEGAALSGQPLATFSHLDGDPALSKN